MRKDAVYILSDDNKADCVYVMPKLRSCLSFDRPTLPPLIFIKYAKSVPIPFNFLVWAFPDVKGLSMLSG
jgi:hypothetical protein